MGEKSHTIILAIKFPDFSILAANSLVVSGPSKDVCNYEYNNTFEIAENIYIASSSEDYNCFEGLKKTLKFVGIPSSFTKVDDAAKHVREHINSHHADEWKKNALVAEFVLMGNDGDTDLHHIYSFTRTGDGMYDYVEHEEESFLCLESGGDDTSNNEVQDLLKLINQEVDPEKALDIAYNIVRGATYGAGGNITIISFHRNHTKTTLLEQDDPRDANSLYLNITETRKNRNRPGRPVIIPNKSVKYRLISETRNDVQPRQIPSARTDRLISLDFISQMLRG